MCCEHRSSRKDQLYKLEEYSAEAVTRKGAYQRLSEEAGTSVGSLYTAASRAGMTSPSHSLRFAFSEEEEKALVTVCLLYARQGTPLTIYDFLELASHFAKMEEGHLFSRHFALSFIARHSDALCKRKGKLTSPTRSYEAMQQKTEEFIASMDEIMATNTINKNNMVVFDETVIGDSVTLPLYIGEQKDSGGGSINVYRVRESRLGSYIPFSLPDGSTPFKVFILRDETMKKGDGITATLEPGWEKGLRGDSHRIFLKSERGFINIELFTYIMDEFRKWWTATRPGLHCFLICDNLSVHRNDTIVKTARRYGIHMIYIMPGSSHWFQVHDQFPFGTLKKEMASIKLRKVPPISLEPESKRTTMTSVFYEAEELAFRPHIVRKAFANVGLSPWNPSRIRDALQKHCRQVCSEERDRAYFTLSESVKVCEEKKYDAYCQMVGRMKPVGLTVVKLVQKAEDEDDEDAKSSEQEKQARSKSTDGKHEDISGRPPKKRAHRLSLELKRCSVRGCQETHFWSKKWNFCAICNKHFCPFHEKVFHHHKCKRLSYCDT